MTASASVVYAGAIEHLEELRRDRLQRRRVDRSVERDDAAEGAGGVGGERETVGIERRRGDGDAARIGVLDDDAGRLGEGLHALPRRVGVADVVVRELLALQLPVGRDRARGRLFVAVERRLLVRVLAVAQVLHLRGLEVEAVGEGRRRAVGAARRQPVADRAVVGRRVRERLPRQRESRRRGQRAAVGLEFGDERRIVRGIDDDADVLPVLRRGAHHRRTADVDVLDRVVQRAAGPRDGLAERVQVDDDQVDGRDRVLLERRGVRRDVAAREDAAVDLRVQRLDAAVEHLGEARVIADLGDGESRVGERLRRAPGREQPHAEPREGARELDHAGLVGNGNQRLGNRGRHGTGLRGSRRGVSAACTCRACVRSVLRLSPEHVGRLRLVAVGATHHRRQQRLLDVSDHHVVDVVRRLAVELAEVLLERMLDAAADLVAAVEADLLLHAARASPPRRASWRGTPNAPRASTTHSAATSAVR